MLSNASLEHCVKKDSKAQLQLIIVVCHGHGRWATDLASLIEPGFPSEPCFLPGPSMPPSRCTNLLEVGSLPLSLLCASCLLQSPCAPAFSCCGRAPLHLSLSRLVPSCRDQFRTLAREAPHTCCLALQGQMMPSFPELPQYLPPLPCPWHTSLGSTPCRIGASSLAAHLFLAGRCLSTAAFSPMPSLSHAH